MSPFRHYSRSAAHGFTLIELLAVIAVIGVLSAILLAVLGRVRDAARSARCASNLRQLMPAFISFAEDHRGHYPRSLKGGSSAYPRNNWWFDLSPYLGQILPGTSIEESLKRTWGSNGIGCPTTDTSATRTLPWVSYKMTGKHREWLNNAQNGFTQEKELGLPMSRIANPSSSLLVAEGWSATEFITWTTVKAFEGLCYPHGGKTNALFADGHVKSMTEYIVSERWSVIYTRAISP